MQEFLSESWVEVFEWVVKQKVERLELKLNQVAVEAVVERALWMRIMLAVAVELVKVWVE